MTPQEYTEQAMRTAKPLSPRDMLVHAAMGLVSDFGELVTIIKAHRIYGKPLDIPHLREEAGDVLWFIQYCAVVTEDNLSGVVDYAGGYIRTKSYDEAVIVGGHCIGRICGNIDVALTVKEGKPNRVEMHSALSHLFRCVDDICIFAGLDLLGDVAPANITKLRLRYPNRYTDEAAIARRDKNFQSPS